MRPTVVVVEEGRLGNQLAQYYALTTLFTSCRLVVCGWRDLRSAVTPESRIVFIPITGRILRVVGRSLGWLRAIGIIGEIRESQTQSSYRIEVQTGWFPQVFSLLPGYFQHPDVLDREEPTLSLRDELTTSAQNWLRVFVPTVDSRRLVFIHLRRGDYLTWPSPGAPAYLNQEWLESAVQSFEQTIGNPVFLVFSDDKVYAKNLFGQRKNFHFPDGKPFEDLALMSCCSHGILSPSSFSYWGAKLSRQNAREKDQHIYLAPKFWAGHRRGEWFPPGFQLPWITYK